VALQGSLDTFALVDVLRLLANTRKTGRLRLSGARGQGTVWLDGGGVVAAGATGSRTSDGLVDMFFELLRYDDGTFVFESDMTTPDAGAPADVDAVVAEAEVLLAEWRDIAAVVPSMDLVVRLAPELPNPEVVVDASRWRVIVATGSGRTVRDLGDHLGLGELAVGKAVKDLTEAGLVTLEEGSTPAPAPATALAPAVDAEAEQAWSSVPGPAPTEQPLAGHPLAGAADAVDEQAALSQHLSWFDQQSSPAYEPLPGFSPGPADETSTGGFGIEIPGFSSLAPAARAWQPEPEPETQPEPVVADAVPGEDPEEIAKRLGPLTPQAARAIAAAARASSDTERDEALSQATDANDEPLDRSLLLKFLSSVKQ